MCLVSNSHWFSLIIILTIIIMSTPSAPLGSTKKVEGAEDTSCCLPQRCIFNSSDMQHFRESTCRRELLGFVRALGMSCRGDDSGGTMDSSTNYCGESTIYRISSSSNSINTTSIAIACLWGSLCAMEKWVTEIPPDTTARARFGNPAFKTWYTRLQQRAPTIVAQILVLLLPGSKQQQQQCDDLQQASSLGFQAASKDDDEQGRGASSTTPHVMELQSYLLDSFGHPVRIDYGTGHESSFLVFLYSLSKLGAFSSSLDFKALALGIFSQYLKVARTVQTTYMLEPAGSHGVWGLDDYYCLPFYFGACQLQHQHHPSTIIKPPSIHDKQILNQYADKYMYLGCIQFIKQIKTNVPFFESSPMLNDISHLSSWLKVSTGLLRLYEAEVLDKLPVVQHFKFGTIFQATWIPSQSHPLLSAPTTTPFSLHSTATATTAHDSNSMTITRAPWATTNED